MRCALLCACLLTACAQYHGFVNAPLDRYEPGPHPILEELDPAGRSGELFVVLSLSGGGTRAAALAYGVLDTLARIEFGPSGGRRSLLGEVDVISSVSGGSFTAAYFGLHGPRIFEDFEERFLRKNLTLRLLTRLLFPHNWLRLASPRFGRSELAAEYYDRILFDGAVLGDLRGRGGPLIQIQATDLILGTSFTFTRSHFDPICSEVDSYPVSRAVAASSAVPILFTPVALRNYAGRCGFKLPPWMERALTERDVTRRSFHTARRVRAYLESRRDYIHLVDGGIADNLGVRGPIEVLTLEGGFPRLLGYPELSRTRHVLFIIVNAQTMPDASFGLVDIAPSLAQMLSIVTSLQIHNYNLETIELLRRSVEAWDLATRSSRGAQPVDFYTVEVSLDALRDEEERRILSGLSASYNLSDAAVDRLLHAAQEILVSSPDFQRLLETLDAERASRR